MFFEERYGILKTVYTTTQSLLNVVHITIKDKTSCKTKGAAQQNNDDTSNKVTRGGGGLRKRNNNTPLHGTNDHCH